MAFKSMATPRFFFTWSTAFWITVSVRSPRKSIFRSPSSSSVVMVNWVVMVPSAALESGTYSSTDSRLMTTPAACIEECLGRPSRRMDMSIKYLTSSSSL